jgi:hypothetical protein
MAPGYILLCHRGFPTQRGQGSLRCWGVMQHAQAQQPKALCSSTPPSLNRSTETCMATPQRYLLLTSIVAELGPL